MAIYGVHLIDGPCSGRYTLWDSTNNDQPTLVCNNFTYYLTFGVGLTATGSIKPPAASPLVGTGAGMSAWNQLRHTVNWSLPGELHLASRYLRAALHELRHIRIGG